MDKENIKNSLSNIYNELQICKPDNLCKLIKNPLQYSKRKFNLFNEKD